MDTNNAHPEESSSPAVDSASAVKTSSLTASLVNLILAVVAGMIAWYLLQTYGPDPTTMISEELQSVNAYSPMPMQDAQKQAIKAANQQLAIATLAGLGGLLGIALGLAGGLLQRSLTRIVLAGIVGAILGMLCGALGGWLGNMIFDNAKPAVEPVTLTAMSAVELVALGLLGAGIGIGIGLTLGAQQPVVESTLFGLLAGATAGILYPITTASFLPMVVTETVIPMEANARLLWIMMTAVCLGLILPLAGSRRPPRTKAKTD